MVAFRRRHRQHPGAVTTPEPLTLGHRFRLQARGFDTADEGCIPVEHPEVTGGYRVSRKRDHYEQTLADVTSVISHDIRSPMTAALSWAELVVGESEQMLADERDLLSCCSNSCSGTQSSTAPGRHRITPVSVSPSSSVQSKPTAGR